MVDFDATFGGVLEGCGYCGAYCTRCASVRVVGATYEIVEKPNGLKCFAEGFLWAAPRPNRHDARRAASGPYCGARERPVYADLGGVSVAEWNRRGGLAEMVRGRRVRSPGEEWALMCRRVRGAVQTTYVAGAVLGGRKTQLLKAIVAGGWRPSADDPLAPNVADVCLRLQFWLRQPRRSRVTRGSRMRTGTFARSVQDTRRAFLQGYFQGFQSYFQGSKLFSRRARPQLNALK